jgi:hypothetical protein
MATIAQIDNEVIAGIKARELEEKKPPFNAGGVQWGFRESTFDGRPYIEVSCDKCHTLLRTQQADFVWRHCKTVSEVPAELNERLVKLQIKLGLRKPEGGFIKKLFGQSEPAPPALSNF